MGPSFFHKRSAQIVRAGSIIALIGLGCFCNAITYRLKLHKVVDPATHMKAGQYLAPSGWTAKDEITWMPLNYGTPVIGRSTVSSPDGHESLVRVSALSVNYGSSSFGRNGMPPPPSIGIFLAQLWAKEHPGVSYQIVDKSQSPIKTANGQYRTYSYDGSVKISFTKNGLPMLVKGFARIDGYQTQSYGGAGVTEGQWTVSNIVAMTAPSGKLESAMKLFAICIASYSIDPKFFSVVLRVQKWSIAHAYKDSENALSLSRHLAQNQSAISADIMSVYNNRSKAMDSMNEKFDDYIRGLDSYSDGEGHKIKLPYSHNHWFSDGNGDYYYSDSSTKNPRGYRTLSRS